MMWTIKYLHQHHNSNYICINILLKGGAMQLHRKIIFLELLLPLGVATTFQSAPGYRNYYTSRCMEGHCTVQCSVFIHLLIHTSTLVYTTVQSSVHVWQKRDLHSCALCGSLINTQIIHRIYFYFQKHVNTSVYKIHLRPSFCMHCGAICQSRLSNDGSK